MSAGALLFPTPVAIDDTVATIPACPPQPRLNARALIEHWRTVPALDAQALREDLAAVLDLDL